MQVATHVPDQLPLHRTHSVSVLAATCAPLNHTDVSDSDDQGVIDSEGSTDEEGDWRPAKKQRGAKPAAAAASGRKKASTASRRAPAAAAAAAAAGGGSAAAAAGAAAPPMLFRPKDPSKMTAAEKRAEVLNASRTIHATGGQGGRTKSNNGACTLTLPPGVCQPLQYQYYHNMVQCHTVLYFTA